MRVTRETTIRSGQAYVAPNDHHLTSSSTRMHANERARSVFGSPPNDLGRPLQDLNISYNPADLRTAIDQATTGGSSR